MIIRTLIASAFVLFFSQNCLAETLLKIEPNILKNVDVLAKAKEYAYKKYPRLEGEEYYAFLEVNEDGYGVTFSAIDLSKNNVMGNASKKLMVYVLIDKEGKHLKKIHLIK